LAVTQSTSTTTALISSADEGGDQAHRGPPVDHVQLVGSGAFVGFSLRKSRIEFIPTGASSQGKLDRDGRDLRFESGRAALQSPADQLLLSEFGKS
jgi:hypothetical protein